MASSRADTVEGHAGPDHVPADPQGRGQAASLHVPVLLDQVLEFFTPRPGGRCLDATLGLGGHSSALLRKALDSGITDVSLLGLDRDQAALRLARERLAPFKGMVHTRHSAFSDAGAVLDEIGWDGLDFALADIGVSSMQIDLPERGFSFKSSGPLDMRMDRSQGKTAETLVNELPVLALKEMIERYGEDPMAGRIARAIDDARSQRRIENTLELARVVEGAYPAKWKATSRNHPATRTFQALRMAVNNELGELERFLECIVSRLRPGGRVAIITFHSLEDRLVKHFFRDKATGCRCPRFVPRCVCGISPDVRVLTKKPLGPAPEEASANPRAASAKLRVAEKLGHG